MSFYSLTTVLGFLILFEPWTFSFMDPFSFSFKLLRLANFDQSWQSCKNAKTKKQLTFGEFCYLPAALCPFLEKVASQNSTQKKDTKWATKWVVKKKDKRKKWMQGKSIETDSQLEKLEKAIVVLLASLGRAVIKRQGPGISSGYSMNVWMFSYHLSRFSTSLSDKVC